jgi:hypothetical protein
MILLSLSLSLKSRDNSLMIKGGKRNSNSRNINLKKKKEVQYDDDDDHGNNDDIYDVINQRQYDSDEDVDTKNDNEDNDNNDNNDNNDDDDDDDDDRKEIHKKKKSSSVVGSSVKGISTLAHFAVKLTKKSFKSSVDFLASAHVMQSKILGKWRLHQEIEVRKGIILSCPATVEFLDDSTLLTFFNDEEYKSEYAFKEKNWPQKCSISFNAKAFQGPKDSEPINLYYHGYFKRSLLNPNIIFIRGKVYSLKGKSFWKQQKKIGKFKLTKSRY